MPALQLQADTDSLAPNRTCASVERVKDLLQSYDLTRLSVHGLPDHAIRLREMQCNPVRVSMTAAKLALRGPAAQASGLLPYPFSQSLLDIVFLQHGLVNLLLGHGSLLAGTATAAGEADAASRLECVVGGLTQHSYRGTMQLCGDANTGGRFSKGVRTEQCGSQIRDGIVT